MKTLTMSEFRKQPGEHLIDVRRQRESLLLTRAGKPIAQIIPVEEVIASLAGLARAIGFSIVRMPGAEEIWRYNESDAMSATVGTIAGLEATEEKAAASALARFRDCLCEMTERRPIRASAVEK